MVSYLKKYPAFTLSIIYLYLSFCGLLYQYFLLKDFNINPLYFISLEDFFISFIKSLPVVIVIILFQSINLITDFYFYQKRIKERTNRLSFLKRVILVMRQQKNITIITFITFLPIFSITGATMFESYRQKMQIEVNYETSTSLNIPTKSYIIDSTKEYLFLLDKKNIPYIIKKEKISSFKILYEDK